MRRLFDILKDIQNVRCAVANRERGLPFGSEGLFSDRLEDIEKDLTKKLKVSLGAVPIYEKWLKEVEGVGPRIAAAWISNIMISYKHLEEPSETQKTFAIKTKGEKELYPTLRGIGAFPTISKLWAWCGQDVQNGEAPKRSRNGKIRMNPKTQALAWLTGRQFRLAKGYYADIYRKYKEELYRGHYGKAVENPQVCPRYEKCREKLLGAASRLGREPKKFPCKKHVDNMAMRHAVKDFLRDLWIKWRQTEGLPVSGSYETEVLGHNHNEGLSKPTST